MAGPVQARQEALRWRAPTNAPVDGYRIHLGYSSGRYEEELTREVRGRKPGKDGVVAVLLDSLDPDVDYYVAVTAFNRWGSSGFSNEKLLPAGTSGCVVDADCSAAAPCSVGVCNGAAGCGTAPVADGTACDDGDPSTVGDACSAGTCTGQRASHGTCSRDADCSDGQQCNGIERCRGGRCVSGAPVSCRAPTQCTVGICVEGRGCDSAPTSDGVPCDDGDPDTGGDACRAGVCVGRNSEPSAGPDAVVSTLLSALGVVAREIASGAEGDAVDESPAVDASSAPLGIDFGAELSIFVLSGPITACGPDFCVFGDVQTDDRGRLTGSASIEGDGGSVLATLRGSLKGRNGVTQVKLAQRLSGTLDGVRVRAASKLQGEIDPVTGLFDFDVASSACARGARCQRKHFRDSVALDPALGSWKLDLDLDEGDGRRVGGSATARLGDGSVLNYVVQGTYQPNRDEWRLRLRSVGGRSSIELRGVVIDEGRLRGGRVSYRILGHSGKGDLEP